MKGKQLRKAVLLGMAMSMAIWTTGMAEEIRIENPIEVNQDYGETYNKPTDNFVIETSTTAITQGQDETGSLKITSQENVIDAGISGIHVNGKGEITLQATQGGNYITSGTSGTGILASGGSANVTLIGETNTIIAEGDQYQAGIKAGNGSTDTNKVSVTSTIGDITITAGNKENPSGTSRGIIASGGTVELNAQNDINIQSASDNGNYGSVEADNGGIVNLDAGHDVIIGAANTGSGTYGVSVGLLDDLVGTVKPSLMTINADNDIHITSTGTNSGNIQGISVAHSNLKLDAGNEITIHAYGYRPEKQIKPIINTVGIYNYNGTAQLGTQNQNEDITIAAHGNDTVALGIQAYSTKETEITIKGNAISITADTEWNNGQAGGISNYSATGIEAQGYGNNNEIKVIANSDLTISGNIVNNTDTTAYSSGITATYNSNVSVESLQGSTYISGLGQGNVNGTGLRAQNGATIGVTAREGINNVNANSYGVYALYDNSQITLQGKNGNKVDVIGESGYAVRSYGTNAKVSLTSEKGNNILTSAYRGILAQSNGTVSLLAQEGSNSVSADNDYAAFASGETLIDMDAKLNNIIKGNTYGIVAKQGIVTLDAGTTNSVTGINEGVYAYTGADINMTAGTNNSILAGDTTTVADFGTKYGIDALSGSTVTLDAGNQNAVLGAVYANGTDTIVQVSGLADESGNYGNSRYNYVGSAAVIANAGNLNKDKSGKFTDTDVVSALYAEDGATIVVSGERNEFRSYAADPGDTGTLERTVWAYDGANIEINGSTLISTDRYDATLTAQQGNSADIAIAAGTAVNLTNDQVLANADPKSTVTLNYGAGSSITGDILSAYAGQVDIQAQDGSDAGIAVKGNILAGNNGVLNIDLGKGGYLEGRADDYGDAGLGTVGEDIDQGHATHEFFNPAFSSTIFKGGEVNLSMGEGSRWNVTGQSWVTRINTESAALADDVLAAENPVEAMNHMATIDLVEANTDRNTNAHALTVYEMTGDAVFNMSLDADRDVSDMLYMKSANGDYIINVVDAVTLDDMYAEGFDGLRFATVGEGSNVSFRAVTVGQGVFNVEYEVGTDAYANNDENHAYNGGESVSEDKPGSDLVDGFFESTQEPGTAETQASRKRMRMAAMAMPAAANDGVMLLDDTAAADDTAAVDGSVDETTNFKLIGRKDESTSNAGKTIIAMSKVNYSNAVYMDRLNKRMGEARYIDGDEGLWVRMRHDRIGKSDAFRSKNTMFELGYDRKVGDREDGEHRQGVVFDYMRGTADYHNVAGEGDVRRGGVWFYDTWLGNKGHYTDYVLKFGRLSNDFDIYSELGEKITGDYSNFVYSASAEYGRKKDLGNNWYIEPQAQIQYAHVTDADYTTSQDTHVQLDAIDSLIGRVGFRLGKDVGEKSTFYIKADVLHEFLGDQDIEARDATGLLSTTYENEGTWYDIGLGFSHQFSKGTYMYLDMEKSIGNDNEDTYQFNFGMNWKV